MCGVLWRCDKKAVNPNLEPVCLVFWKLRRISALALLFWRVEFPLKPPFWEGLALGRGKFLPLLGRMPVLEYRFYRGL